MNSFDTLVLIDNNLKLDNRVKRHIGSMLELSQRVRVLACPLPDDQPGLVSPGLETVFWRAPPTTLRPDEIGHLLQQTGLSDTMFNAFPSICSVNFFDPEVMAISRRIQERQLEASWWVPFSNPICREDLSAHDDQRIVIALFEHMLRWAAAACEYPSGAVYCNDLLSLPAGVAHKRRFGSKLIFDAHEIFYDMVPGAHSLLWKQALALLEMHLVEEADWVIGVSESHVDWMREIYGRRHSILCVPNCFGLGQEVTPPAERSPQDPLRVYYHGASDKWRGLDNIVRALPNVKSVVLILRCFPSEHLDEVKEIAASLGVADRVQFLPLVESAEMVKAIRNEADVGIHACALPEAENIRVGLSNKFIEYLMAGIPVITSPLDEQARIVQHNQLGFVLNDNSPDEIARSLEWMCANRGRLQEMGRRAYNAGVRHFSWINIKDTLNQALVA